MTLSPGCTYEALDNNRKQIRLFQLAIAQPTPEDLYGTLSIHALDACPPFLALSYEWGADKDLKPLFINGSVLTIRPNLHDFLWSQRRSLLSHQRAPYLWIDQLCIDQQNISERNDQVRLMSCIYSQADEVIAWLGLAYEGPIQEILSSDIDQWKQDLAAERERQRGGRSTIPPPLARLLTSSYWSRLWVQQELVLARAVPLRAGTADLPAKTLAPIENYIYLWDQALWHACNVDARVPKSYSLENILNFYAAKLCSDPRDMVFGFWSSVLPEDQAGLVVDYALSTAQVFEMAVRTVTRSTWTVRSGKGSMDAEGCRTLGRRMGLSEEGTNRIIETWYGDAVLVQKSLNP